MKRPGAGGPSPLDLRCSVKDNETHPGSLLFKRFTSTVMLPTSVSRTTSTGLAGKWAQPGYATRNTMAKPARKTALAKVF